MGGVAVVEVLSVVFPHAAAVSPNAATAVTQRNFGLTIAPQSSAQDSLTSANLHMSTNRAGNIVTEEVSVFSDLNHIGRAALMMRRAGWRLPVRLSR